MALLVDTLDADRDLSLKKLWDLICHAYKKLRTRNRLHHITHGMIKGPSKTFPCISGKALVVRDLLPVMVEVPPRLHGLVWQSDFDNLPLIICNLGKATLIISRWRPHVNPHHAPWGMVSVFSQCMDEADDRHRYVLLGLRATAEMETISHRTRGSYRMTEAASEAFIRSCSTYCQAITYLIRAYTPDRAYFNWTPKSHLIMHYAECSRWIHPRLGSCYAGEELMGIVRRLVQGVARASKPATVSNAALQRWLHGMSSRMGPDAKPCRRM